MLKGASEIIDPDVRALATSAEDFVSGFAWCKRVERCSLGFAVAGVIGIFQVDLVPGPNADPTVWVIVGDLPPAYLAFEPDDTWQNALEGYVAEMQSWIDAVLGSDSLDDRIPVNAPPTPSYANQLASRLTFLRDRLLEVDPSTLQGDV